MVILIQTLQRFKVNFWKCFLRLILVFGLLFYPTDVDVWVAHNNRVLSYFCWSFRVAFPHSYFVFYFVLLSFSEFFCCFLSLVPFNLLKGVLFRSCWCFLFSVLSLRVRSIATSLFDETISASTVLRSKFYRVSSHQWFFSFHAWIDQPVSDFFASPWQR